MLLTIDETTITLIPRFRVTRDDPSTWTLHIRDVQPEDTGYYVCQVNMEPVINQVGYIQVVVPPQFLDEESSPSHVSVQESHDVRLVCRATGVPKPTIRWTRHEALPITTARELKVDNEELVLKSVSRKDMGAYFCIARNKVPPSISKRIVLQVQFQPLITVPTQLVGAPVGTSVTLECKVAAFPNAVHFWRFKDQLLINSSRQETQEIQEGYTTTMKLSLNAIKRSDFGTYVCAAKNSLGETESNLKFSLHPITPHFIASLPTSPFHFSLHCLNYHTTSPLHSSLHCLTPHFPLHFFTHHFTVSLFTSLLHSSLTCISSHLTSSLLTSLLTSPLHSSLHCLTSHLTTSPLHSSLTCLTSHLTTSPLHYSRNCLTFSIIFGGWSVIPPKQRVDNELLETWDRPNQYRSDLDSGSPSYTLEDYSVWGPGGGPVSPLGGAAGGSSLGTSSYSGPHSSTSTASFTTSSVVVWAPWCCLAVTSYLGGGGVNRFLTPFLSFGGGVNRYLTPILIFGRGIKRHLTPILIIGGGVSRHLTPLLSFGGGVRRYFTPLLIFGGAVTMHILPLWTDHLILAMVVVGLLLLRQVVVQVVSVKAHSSNTPTRTPYNHT
ncbi:hypothetical protein Pmani_024849 [Petrolisthes manimaculis]|uniref:Ig-like domain-containing protein n=1 Tax=Petrolisthes manimaculis TaxID=1843537 RepID=A0AAE1P6P3_9EUCA|nr:hypothetical protein Pmani_024849 [Petrolisthes manimaculis]